MGKRRAAGEGTLFRRSDGRWIGRVAAGYDNRGQRRHRTVSATTQGGARERLDALKRDLARGVATGAKSVTVRDHVAAWLRHGIDVTDWTPATAHGYRGIAKKWLVPGLGRHRLDKLTPRHVQQLLDSAHAQGKSPGTVKNIKAALSSALDLAMRWDLIGRNVASRAVVPRMARKPATPLTPDEAKRFLGAVKGHRLGALYTVTTALGLRQSEAAGLLWSNVDLDAGTLAVTQRSYYIDKQHHTGRPKSSHSARTIPLPSAIVDVLKAHRTVQVAERLSAERWEDEDRVFPNTTGGPLHGPYVTRTMQSLMEKAGLGHRTFHGLRHTSATLLLTMGVPLAVIQEQLGHASFTTTRDLYADVLPELQRDAADKMDAFLSSGS